ncbi:hypothetical protein EV356DRAFT_512878 [Viridothelium virens]|uniref:Cation efflux protein transmembrane domain-containing protein n=1 Tax=Viridothelium virens TaxID=1048519 RepID=A0A6A6HFE7_VIRVR|nr:hypothetical protein EV356DRAFT_512878 [Viridothelium virens]
MVGKRQRPELASNGTSTSAKKLGNGDVESGSAAAHGVGVRRRVAPKFGFRDAVNYEIAQQRRDSLKKALLEGIESLRFEEYRKSRTDLEEIKNKKVREFYERQNDRINDWAEVDSLVVELSDDVVDSFNPDADHDGVAERWGPLQRTEGGLETFLPEDERDKRRRDAKKAKWAVNINVVANVLLVVIKIVAASATGSLSLLASLLDSVLDLLCTLIVWTTNKLVQWRLASLRKKFPVGRRRLEPLGILVFSIIMVVSFLQILQESVQKLLPNGDHEVASLPAVAIGAMAGNAVVKGIIGIGCWPIKTTQVQALVQDCKTDVYFNTASLLFPLLGHVLNVWWLDPVGAAILSLYIIYDWADTCLENINRLTGAAVSERMWQKLMLLAYRFSPVLGGYKTLTAYHAGDGVWVEIDIILDENEKVHRAHDVAETLQYCCEGLEEVDRAFVTVDYSQIGPTGHATESG